MSKVYEDATVLEISQKFQRNCTKILEKKIIRVTIAYLSIEAQAIRRYENSRNFTQISEKFRKNFQQIIQNN